MRSADRRRVAEWARTAYQVSERRACSATGVARSTVRYKSCKPSQEPLRRRLRELAAVRTFAGYRRLHTYLRREGWAINHKRVYRLYMEEGLALRRKKRRRRRSAVPRKARLEPTEANQLWSMDFMHDALADGRRLRLFTLIDVYSRECLALVPKVKLDFSRPGKPGDNAHIEAFNSLVRRECLSQHWFRSLEEARGLLEEWKDDYNNDRPHGSLQQMTPARYRAGAICPPGRDEPKIRKSAGPEKG